MALQHAPAPLPDRQIMKPPTPQPDPATALVWPLPFRGPPYHFSLPAADRLTLPLRDIRKIGAATGHPKLPHHLVCRSRSSQSTRKGSLPC
ncbi:uncharacterized protein P884DRAFT_978 [Thermothelomyces heterothallicus CBS 202.75]|uniref:uncharacterized protein n=1 Tax=Thermothelomyces heterothallicus CBS 202.75 TaxID=1149848 RepID=UPI003742AC86